MKVSFEISKKNSSANKRKVLNFIQDVEDGQIKIHQAESTAFFECTEEVNDIDNPIKASQCKDRGCSLAESGDFRSAITVWNEGLIYENNNAFLHELLSQGYLHLGRWLDAAKSAERVVEISPTWSDGHLTLARAQRELGELEMSIQSYMLAIELDSANSDAILELEEMEAIASVYRAKRGLEYDKINTCVTEGEIEAQTCIFNLRSRAISPPDEI